MTEPQTYTTPQPQPAPQKRSSTSNVVFITLLVLLTGAAGSFAYLWYHENNRANQLSNEVSSLKTAQTNTQDQTPQQTSFTAQVGKFTLALPKEYVIIKVLDGGAEGASGATTLKIGKPNPTFAGVVDDPAYSDITLNATRASDHSNTTKTFENWKAQVMTDPNPQKLEPITVDGVTADTYKFMGLGDILVAFFQKDGLWYNVKINTDDVAAARQTLKDILEGFTFDS